MNCRAKHNPALKRRGGNLHLRNLHPSTVIYRRLCLARHFSAGSGRLPSARGFNPMLSPAVETPGWKSPSQESHPRTVIYRRLCLARHFSAGSVRLPSARGFNPMHSPVVLTPGWGGGMDSHKKRAGLSIPALTRPCMEKIYKYCYSSMFQFSAAKRL